MNKKLRAKMEDYKRFAVILLCLAIFSYLGSIVATVQATDQTGLMLGMSALLAAGAGMFFWKSATYRKILAEEEDTGSL